MSRHLRGGPTYYAFQQLCYLDFLDCLGNEVLDHYYTLPQYISHQALIFHCTVHYQKCMSKLHTLDNREKFPISGEGIRTVTTTSHPSPTHLSPPVCSLLSITRYPLPQQTLPPISLSLSWIHNLRCTLFS